MFYFNFLFYFRALLELNWVSG